MKFLLIITSLLLFVSCSSAQYTTTNKKAIKLYLAGKKAPSESIDYSGVRPIPNFREGIKLLDQALEKDPNFLEAHMVVGEFHERLGNYTEAIGHFEKALAIDPQHNTTGSTYFYLANLQQAVGLYNDAIRNIDIFQSNRNANPDLINQSHSIRANCEFALRAMQNPTKFEPINVGPGINTADPEYFPTITVDGKTILFTRRIEDGRVRAEYQEQEDFYVSQLGSNNIWMKAKPMPPNINTVHNEGAPTIGPDGRTLVFVACPDGSEYDYGENRQGKGHCDLFITKKLGSRWTDPVNLPGNANTFHWESQPSLSSDGKTMYFIRGLRGRSAGTSSDDIYVTRLGENGLWGAAERLPDHINSTEQEESVLIHPDGKTLYFASRGHVGMGGTDLFMSKMDDNGNWSRPVNLGYPINTKFDENSLMVSPDGEIAFFASNREGGFGDLDIYYFTMPEEMRPTKTLYFEGLVYDVNTRKPLPGKFQLIDLATGKEVMYAEADAITGEFMVPLPVNKEYALNVTYPGYTFFSQNFDMKNPENLEAVHMDVPMIPIGDTSGVTVLANVFFDLAKSTLRKESYIELDKMVAFLKENKELKVEFGGHTDSRGTNNKVLSEKRAQAVYNYIVDKGGIDPKRLSHKGYGSSQPVNTDEYIAGLKSDTDKEAAHQENRRTEYKIVK